jgi:SAM-dependent methyltransferase|tara:strand:+ start:1076 stop:2692 length:1617 start_codon:yes stop_codon:yes gene_type:complete
MYSKPELRKLRSKLFRHLDGIVIAPSAYALKNRGVTDYLLAHKSADLNELAKKFDANEGYLNIALRGLCSQGWLVQYVDNKENRVTFKTNEVSEIAFNHFHVYKEVVSLLRQSTKHHPRKFEMEPFLLLEDIYNKFKNNFGIELSSDPLIRNVQDQILIHIEGNILGPTLVHLGMSGMFHKYFMQTRFRPEEFHRDFEGFRRLLNILTDLNFFKIVNDSYEFTEYGLFFAKRASAYGVTVSYIPTLSKLDDLIFSDPLILKSLNTKSEEKTVDREMNVWGSGGAHASYFKGVDDIIIEMFNKPINEQPRGILDMGCGNGAFLQHLFTVIDNQTYRGTVLEEYPLIIIGADYNETALNVSRENLIKYDIWAKIVWGDIGNPDLLAADLKDKYNVELEDLLNVRTFLDHNRIWETPKTSVPLYNSSSTGAYASNGKRINNNLISVSLTQHLNKWTPHIKKFGLLLIELHTVKPELVAKHIGETAASAYDLTHGYSDQYILEVDEFLKAAAEAGLVPDENSFRKYPNSDFATVSINLFKTL